MNEVGSAARSNRGVLILSLNQVDNRDWMMGVEVLAGVCDASLDIAGIYRRIWDARGISSSSPPSSSSALTTSLLSPNNLL